jgi:DNA-binding CsgD family transcriptional regulator
MGDGRGAPPTTFRGNLMSPNTEADRRFQANRWLARLNELGIQPPPPGIRESATLPEALAAVRARENELNCIYSFTQLMDREQYSVDDFLSSVVDTLPPWWRYPEIACARIEMGSKVFRSLFYQEGPWEQISPILFPGDVTGQVAIIYSEDRPAAEEGPFLKEERKLLDAVANRVGRVVELKQTNAQLAGYRHQLEIERTSLRDANAALRLVLDRIEEERHEAERKILDNVDRILMPIIRELETSATPEQEKYVALLSENLGHITSPFIRSLTRESEALTTTEVQICKLIRDGMGSKQIADLRGTSVATIHRHRENIRHKLGITHQKVNLASYLQTIL